MNDGDESVLQRRGMVDQRTEVQVLRERHRRAVFIPGAPDPGEALEFEDEDFGCRGEAGEFYALCPLVALGAVSDRVDVVEVSVRAVLEEMI